MSKHRILDSATTVGAFASLLSEAPATARKVSAHDRHRHSHEEALRAEFEKARTEGYAAGFEEGREAGRIEGFEAAREIGLQEQREQIETFCLDLKKIDRLVDEGMQEWMRLAEIEVEGLVTNIARRVLQQELEQSRSSVLAIVQTALGDVTLSKSARIRVNPFDCLTLQAAKPDLLSLNSALRTIEIVEDASILGGCVIETDGGDVDATLDGQMLRLEAA